MASDRGVVYLKPGNVEVRSIDFHPWPALSRAFYRRGSQ
jgi:hypothetical protein